MKKKLAIIGASELGTLVKYFAESSGEYIVAGYYDDFKTEKSFNGTKILGTTEQIAVDFKAGNFDLLFIGIGYNHMKKRELYFNRFHKSIPFANIIHPSAYIDSSVKTGTGIIVFPGCVVDCFSELKDNILLNTSVSISHHTTIESHCFIAPCVQIAGRVNVGETCFIGIGTVIKDMIHISKECTVGAGSLVLKNTEPGQLLLGSPARVRRKTDEK